MSMSPIWAGQAQEFIRIEPGEYIRGFNSSNRGDNRFKLGHPYSQGQNTGHEKPHHKVKITKGFELGKTEVTVAQFRQFVESTNYVTDAEKNGGGTGFFPDEKNYVDRFKKSKKVTWKSPGFEQLDSHPVVAVSWKDAVAYCEWLSKVSGKTCRLPTEAEWEYACRAGTDTWYSWGNYPDPAYTHANVADGSLEAKYPKTTSFQRAVKLGADEGDGAVFTAKAGSYKPNPWGLHDMHGNVWEWCQDRWKADAYKLAHKGLTRSQWKDALMTDPAWMEATPQHEYGDWRVMRGGGWTNAPASCRSSIRTYAEAGDAVVYTGFRVLRELE